MAPSVLPSPPNQVRDCCGQATAGPGETRPPEQLPADSNHHAGTGGSGAQLRERGSGPAPDRRAMSGNDHPGTAGGRVVPAGRGDDDGPGAAGGQPDPSPSRRAILRGAAGAGVAGVAASTLLGFPARQALASRARPAPARTELGRRATLSCICVTCAPARWTSSPGPV